MKGIIQRYIDKLDVIYSTGNATEHSYRGEFKQLCEECLNINHKKGKKGLFTLVNEPKRKSYGAPDYELLKDDISIAFIEAKQIGDSDLRGENAKRNKKQFDRYKDAISTIAFTDYLNIILYENGEESMSSCIGLIENGHVILNDNEEDIQRFIKILTVLGKAEPRPIRSANVLADRMAKKAKLIAAILQAAMDIDESHRSPEDNELWGKLKTFQKFLVHDMTVGQFVDFYSQTILYGLFIARINDKTPDTFSLSEASDLIPSINPFLKKIFKEIALAHLHPMVKGVVEDLVLLFKVTDMKKVLKVYQKDPLVHFYEDFLAAYNPKIREDFGVWYTPIQVVSFMVNATDYILRNDLSVEYGLANNSLADDGRWHKVQILDPATGTGTFLSVIAEKIYENYKGQEGLWSSDAANHIIPRMNGFEYLIAPYTMAHLKLSSALKLDNVSGQLPERLNIFLTNSLEEDHPASTLDFARYITDESNAASVIKRDTPVMVVIGNPPYNEKSSNKGKWIMDLMDDYKQEPGKKLHISYTKKGKEIRKNSLQETNAKGINNDYCKFIRLGHNFVKKTEEGVMAYICGNTFTKTNIFRGMRYELLKDFDDIYIINLHGSSKFDESTENVKDENIFDIMVGVSINIFVKRKESSRKTLAKVHYKDVYGTRKEKLDYLSSTKFEDIQFDILNPQPPFYEMTMKSSDYEELKQEFQSGFRLDELLMVKVQGFTTDKDNFAIQESSFNVKTIIDDFVSGKTDDELRLKYSIKDTRDWSLSKSRESLLKAKDVYRFITKVCYRPFDFKFTYLHKDIVTYPRPIIQKDMMGRDNLALCIGKQGNAIGNSEWSLVYISNLPTDKNVNPRGGAYLFPLYSYDDKIDKEFGNKVLNLNLDIIESLEEKTGLRMQKAEDTERAEDGFLGVDVIDYIYAVLHSHKYRKRYHQFLQNNFPIIPYPKNAEYFKSMAQFGKRLRKLHLLEGISQSNFITQYPVAEGSDIVTKRMFESVDGGLGKVWINADKYFDNVPKEAWDIFISGYQPLDKWLKDRTNKCLSGDEIRHFQKMVVALSETTKIMKEIDEEIEFHLGLAMMQHDKT